MPLNLMFGRKNLLAHLKSPLTPLGVGMLLALSAYLFFGLILLGVGAYWLAVLMLMPIVAIAALMTFREWTLPASRSGSIWKTVGIVNAILVTGYLIYIGVQFYAASKA